MLSVVTWLWGSDKYSAKDVRKLRDGVARHLEQPYRFVVFTDRQSGQEACDEVAIHVLDEPLLKERGCFARLRLFDPEWQKLNGLDERIVCLDLDMVITGPLDPLFNRAEPFVILHGANSHNPCKFNGSIWLLRAGYRPDVWTDFSLEAASKVPFYNFPDDQGWMWHKMPNAAGWECGPRSGVYAFQKTTWPKGSVDLPADARMVVFPGWRSPRQFKHLDWIKANWK